MEGVGARLGRSSTRYGPATVFNGPVRKWKKRWVHVNPSSSNNNNNNNNSNNNNHHHHHQTNHNHNNNHHNHTSASTSNANGNSNAASHLLLYKWTPLSNNNNSSNGSNGNADKSPLPVKDDVPPQEPPRRKFKYVPVDLLEKQEKESKERETEKIDDDVRVSDSDPTAEDKIPKNDALDEKPDINDVPMEENQSEDGNQVVRQDLNESTLDLSLGLKSHDDESESNGKLERVTSSIVGS
ncbi:hypothetical protein Tsubulata_016943 [Turnera subulata]|uniref:Uncharacterized protein n=1 Tax=Turnera subulata TaxID=218843 RepID=A0A9Q0J748_9ROSI|nr:hypothetical protein Tsubulata_016943 [Turnera subulata]